MDSVIRTVVRPLAAVSQKTLEEYANDSGGKLGPYEEFDFGEMIGIEKWLDEQD